ncbi:MAG: outer membrane protein assembly factor BamD [Pseudomonadota bacterium]
MRFPKILSIFSLVLLLAGCSTLTEDETAEWDAEKFYQTAKEALDSGDYATAIDYYTKLEARYPYGRYAQQAQLETIYAHYKAQEPATAVAAADRFIKLHPRHPSVDYAYYLRGLATFNQGENLMEKVFPMDRSLRDPATIRESFNYFKALVTSFPESRYVPDAVKRMKQLRNYLARHELHVADYYLRRGSYLAAANRAKYVLENYQQSTAIPEALVIMVKAYRRMDMTDLANDALRVLEKNHPDHPDLAELKEGGTAGETPDTPQEQGE